MKCYLRDKYTYSYIKYDGTNFEKIQNLLEPIPVTQLGEDVLVHLVTIGKPNLSIEKNQYLVVTYKNVSAVDYEVYNEDEFKEKFYTDEDLIEDSFIHIERDENGNTLWIKREPTKQEKKDYVYIERDEKGIPIINEEPWAILEYKGDIYPVYNDDYGQQDFIVLDDTSFGGGAYNFGADYDFIDRIDSWLKEKEYKNEN